MKPRLRLDLPEGHQPTQAQRMKLARLEWKKGRKAVEKERGDLDLTTCSKWQIQDLINRLKKYENLPTTHRRTHR